jgi:hypothetical protein
MITKKKESEKRREQDEVKKMSQTRTIGTHKTQIRTQDGYTIVQYWDTEVIKFNDTEIILNSGGFLTNTTKTRINQTSNEYNLGFDVRQIKGDWFVFFKGDKLGFVDNMKMTR